MMLATLIFIITAFVLIFEGKMIVQLITRNQLSNLEQWALGFPIAALVNVLIFFVCTILKIPLTFIIIFVLHAVVILGMFYLSRARGTKNEKLKTKNESHVSSLKSHVTKLIIALIILSISIKLLYAFTHAVSLPTFYYDSLSQWNLRARVSYEDQAIAFDSTEERGISKIQYPILLHSLQISFMLPQGEWEDKVANSSTLLLTLTSFLSLFLILARRSLFISVVALGSIFAIPLMTIHLSQGYGDIHVLQYLMLSAGCLMVGLDNRYSLLVMSALFVVAAAWTKQEGLFFGVIPWIIIFFVSIWKTDRKGFKNYVPALALAPSFLWSIFLISKGLPLSPHSGDLEIAWHSEALVQAIKAMFAQGSFGIFWYTIPILLFVALRNIKKTWKEYLPELAIICWGGITFIQTLFVYFFTPNVQFLLNSQTFSRTMLIPLILLMLGSFMLIQRREGDS